MFFPLREREQIDPKIQFIRYLQEKGGKWYQLGMESKAKEYAWWSENILNGKVWRINVNKTMNRKEEEIAKEALFSYYSRFSVSDQLEGSPNKRAISLIREEVRIIKQNPTENYRRSSDAFKKALIEAYFGIGRGAKLYKREDIQTLLETDNESRILKQCYEFLVKKGDNKDFWFKKLAREEAPGNQNNGIYRFGFSRHHSFIGKVESISADTYNFYYKHPEVELIYWPLSYPILSSEFFPTKSSAQAFYTPCLTIMEEAPGLWPKEVYCENLSYFSGCLRGIAKRAEALYSKGLYYSDINGGMGHIYYDERRDRWTFHGFDIEAIKRITDRDEKEAHSKIFALLNFFSGNHLIRFPGANFTSFLDRLLNGNGLGGGESDGWCIDPPPLELAPKAEEIYKLLYHLTGKERGEPNYFNVLEASIKTIGTNFTRWVKGKLEMDILKEKEEIERMYADKSIQAAQELAAFMIEKDFHYNEQMFISKIGEILRRNNTYVNHHTISYLTRWILVKKL